MLPCLTVYAYAPVAQIGEITIMKEMTNAATTMMSEEEKAEIERQLNQQYYSNKSGEASQPQNIASEAHSEPQPSSSSTTQPPNATSTTISTNGTTSPTEGKESHGGAEDLAQQRAQLREKQRQQREKIREQEEERRRVMKERIKTLTEKLIERLRPYVEAKDPGGLNDPETKAWLTKIGKEAEDLKLESFGVELLHAIGHVYVMKGTTFLKSKKLLGM